MRRRRRWAAALLALALALPCGGRAITWPGSPTGGQAQLRAFIEAANTCLTQGGEQPFNSLFECWPTLAVLGITGEDNAEVPEGIELTATLEGDRLAMLELRVSDLPRFPAIAAALLQAASGGQLLAKDAIRDPRAYLQRVQRNPANSFADTVLPEPGDTARAYYAYRPNLYNDGANWLVLTLVLPRAGAAGSVEVTPVPTQATEQRRTSAGDESPDWVGYYQDLGDGTYYEYFVTPTPEPDSAVYDD